MSSTAYTPLMAQDPDIPASLSVSPERIVRQRVGRPSHGLVLLLHTIFKLSALFLYLVGLHSFVATFIIVILLLSADFWVVKNVSGRLLAGLRWWSTVDDGGKLQWRYESWSLEERQTAQQGEATYFWTCLLTGQCLWLLLAAVCLFSLKLRWLVLCSLALCLNTANLVGYIRARVGKVDLGQKVISWVAKVLLRRQEPSQGEAGQRAGRGQAGGS